VPEREVRVVDLATFMAELEALGFVEQGESRWGGRQWALARNRYLTMTVHLFDGDEAVLTWSFDLGEFALDHDMQIGAGETSFQELYPRYDVKLPPEPGALRGEIERLLSRLRLDLGAPDL
jgi:hypothetical protein